MLIDSQLGKKSLCKSSYDKALLYVIPRENKRKEIKWQLNTKFYGEDIWTAFEVSWLNSNGKPIVKIGYFAFEAQSKNIIESKSFKLYLNSFNNTHFVSEQNVQDILTSDLSQATKCQVQVRLMSVIKYKPVLLNTFDNSINIDSIEITTNVYNYHPQFLKIQENKITEESLTTNLLKTNCLVTNQPDWGSILIYYNGYKIIHSSLLKYIISFRNHSEFHEQCVERIYLDILNICRPQKLLVYARYNRRGGLDINPIRANFKYDTCINNVRLLRQ